MTKKISQEAGHILAGTYCDAAIIKENLQKSMSQYVTMDDIPESIIPSMSLFKLVVGYMTMHNKLVEAELLQPLNHKQTLN